MRSDREEERERRCRTISRSRRSSTRRRRSTRTMPGTHLKYENNPKIKKAIAQKFTEYLRPAEEIRAVLDEGGPGPTADRDAAVATRPKTKPKDGYSCGDGQDPEQS